MKDTIHYQVGQQVGDFTISSYDKNEGRYQLTCKCGATSIGASDHITRKISLLLSEGYVACQNCTFKYQQEFKETRIKNDKLYTYKDVYREYVKKAKERGISFELSLDQASVLFEQNCYYCGSEPRNFRTRQNGQEIIYQGIDRVDNKIGYNIENVVACCKYCNSSKMDRTQDDFLNHISKIYFNKVHRLEQMLVASSEAKWESPSIEG